MSGSSGGLVIPCHIQLVFPAKYYVFVVSWGDTLPVDPFDT
jgi:hypothetical protein